MYISVSLLCGGSSTHFTEPGDTSLWVSEPSLGCFALLTVISYSTSLDLTSLHNLLFVLNANIPQHYLPPSRQPTTPQSVSPSFFTPPAVPAPPVSGTYNKLTYLHILLKTLSNAMHSWPLFRSSRFSDSNPIYYNLRLASRP
jgi:hypothetical protein